MTSFIATLVRSDLSGFKGTAHLYHLSPALDEQHEYVIVSAVYANPDTDLLYDGGDETFIFPSTLTGMVADWGHLPGSFRGEQNHNKALNNLGYTVMVMDEHGFTPVSELEASDDA